MVRHTAHRGLLFLGLVPIPGGEGQIQFSSRQLGILVEHLVEVTQAEKQDAILVLFFNVVILPPHGGQFIIRFCHRLNLFL